MKKLIALALSTAFAAAALTGTAAAAPATPSAEAGASQNIVEIASSLGRYSTLVQLVVAADLVDALSHDGSMTVLAPTNKGFNKLEALVPGVTAALLDPANKELLRKVLLYHVIPAEVKSGAAAALAAKQARVGTALGNNPWARVKLRGKKNIFFQDSANISGYNLSKVVNPFDVMASNGVIHTVNKVLIPKSVAKALVAAGLI